MKSLFVLLLAALINISSLAHAQDYQEVPEMNSSQVLDLTQNFKDIVCTPEVGDETRFPIFDLVNYENKIQVDYQTVKTFLIRYPQKASCDMVALLYSKEQKNIMVVLENCEDTLGESDLYLTIFLDGADANSARGKTLFHTKDKVLGLSTCLVELKK